MFAVVVHDEERPAWRKAFAIRDVNIGSSPDNDLVLRGARISGHHARIVNRSGRYILVDLKSETGTFINGRKLTAPLVAKDRDTILIGATRLEIVTLAHEELAGERYAPRDGREAELVAAIGNRDADSRAVYADWLEGNGDHARAELLRLQEAAGDGDRIRELASAIDVPWRSRMLRLPIENCPQFEFRCPKQWAELAPTADEGVRACSACAENVYYCATIDEARGRAAEGKCVAIDIASPRWKGDLEAPFGESVCAQCEIDVGDGLSYCPRCGNNVRPEMMMMGRMA